MEALLLFLPAVIILSLMLLLAWRRHRAMHPRVLLPAIPADVRLGMQDETPEARAFFEQYREFVADFNRAGNPMQYRQLVDLMACGPRSLAAMAAADLAASDMLGRYASDLELRNELGEIVSWDIRRVAQRDQLQALHLLLARLIELGDFNAEAIDVWFAPLLDDANGTGDTNALRRATAIATLARLGTPEQAEAARVAAGDDANLQAEWSAARQGTLLPMPLPPDVGEPVITYADAWQAGAFEHEHAS